MKEQLYEFLGITQTSTWGEVLTRLQAVGIDTLTEEEKPRRLPMADILVLPQLFQPRGADTDATADHAIHVEKLKKNLQHLPAITVMRVGGRWWICLDGHHRLAANLAAGGRRTHIPVAVFDGTTVGAALRFSIAVNSPDKSNMTREQKCDSVLKLLFLGSLTYAEIAKDAGVSESTVDRISRDLRRVQERFPQLDWTQQTYAGIKWALRNDTESRGEWRSAKVKQVAGGLAKQFKSLIKTELDLFAAGVVMHLDDAETVRQLGERLVRLAQGPNPDF